MHIRCLTSSSSSNSSSSSKISTSSTGSTSRECTYDAPYQAVVVVGVGVLTRSSSTRSSVIVVIVVASADTMSRIKCNTINMHLINLLLSLLTKIESQYTAELRCNVGVRPNMDATQLAASHKSNHGTTQYSGDNWFSVATLLLCNSSIVPQRGAEKGLSLLTSIFKRLGRYRRRWIFSVVLFPFNAGGRSMPGGGVRG